MKKLIMAVMLLFTINIYAENKVFIRDYTYNAGDDDSKNSSRKEALKQLKALLSEEVGVHIESSLGMTKAVTNGVSQSYITSEITSLSSSITKLTIIDEKWNGVTYYVKASVKINEEQTMTLLIEAIKSKASEKDIKRLNKILAEQNGNLDKSYGEIKELQKKLVLHEIENQASKVELAEAKALLKKLQIKKQNYNNEITEQYRKLIKIKEQIKKIKYRILTESQKACLLEKGMTKNEIKKSIGNPTAHDASMYSGDCNGIFKLTSAQCDRWYYGTIELHFKENGLLNWKSGCKNIKNIDKELEKYSKNNNKKSTFNTSIGSVHARHIIVKTKLEATKILDELKQLKSLALKSKFIELAKSKSTGPSAPKGGDLGYVSRGQMVPAFDKVLFSMEIGTISPVVKTQFGYHIIYLEDKK